MESSYFQEAVTFFFFFLVFNLQLAWPPHSLACSTAPDLVLVVCSNTLWSSVLFKLFGTVAS